MLGALRPDLEELEKYEGWVEDLEDRDKVNLLYVRLCIHYWWMGEELERCEQYYEKWVASVADNEREDFERTLGPFLDRVKGLKYLLRGECEAAAAVVRQILESINDKGGNAFFNNSRMLARAYQTMGLWHECLYRR